MARLSLMLGLGVPFLWLFLVAVSSAAVIDGAHKRDVIKSHQNPGRPKSGIEPNNKKLASHESENFRPQSPKKRHIRKFDFDSEFASYLGLASQEDTERYLAGDKDSSYRVPADFIQDISYVHPHRPLRLVPGSTPASFAYFTQIYPDKYSDGDIRIEHFSPIVHPFSSELEKNRQEADEYESERYERPHHDDAPVYAPPTSQAYFGRYINKKYSDSSEDDGKKNKYQSPKHFDDDSTPDYKMGYRKFGVYHKFQEEDLYPKKTSSEWLPLNKYSKSKHTQHEPEDYHDGAVSPEDFHGTSEHDEEVSRIKSNIDNEPPYSLNNFDLDDKGELKTKVTKLKDDDAHFISEVQPVRRHKKKRRKHRKKHPRPHHHQGRPAFRSSPDADRNAEFKPPSFEFHNPVNSYVSSPYNPPETNTNLEAEPFKNQPAADDGPSELFQSGPEEDLPLSVEADKDNSLDVPTGTFNDPADIDVDYGPSQLDDLDKDYHIIREAGPREHAERTKDFDRRLPEPDGKVYGSFETFDSQLDSTPKKKFEPFVQYPFEEERQQLKTVVDELIESGKSR